MWQLQSCFDCRANEVKQKYIYKFYGSERFIDVHFLLVLLISEAEGLTGVGSSLVTVDRLGPLAITAADMLTFGTANRVCKEKRDF